MAETFGDLVAGWQPVNETNYYALAAYRGLGRPPGHDDRAERAQADEAIQLATAEAAVRLRQTGAPVSSIFGLSAVVAQDDDPATSARVDGLYDPMWAPGLGLFRDGVLRVPGRAPVERPDLAGAFDLIGFSYYATLGVRAGRLAVHPPERRGRRSATASGPTAWASCSTACTPRCRATPLLVAEYGIGTDDDDERAAYLARGLEVVADAHRRGVDVRGLFHWTGVDNYEWPHGFDVRSGSSTATARSARARRCSVNRRAPQPRSGDVIEGIGELVRAAAVAALEVGVLVADVGDDRVALRFDLGADSRLERHDRRVGVVGR